jgi:far upstream element-binding protein
LKVAVPRAAVGVVIGKGGDMIKKIQNETGARVQFQQGRDDGPGERRCLLTGKPSQVDQARRRIEELIDSVLVSVLFIFYYIYIMRIYWPKVVHVRDDQI